jgi:hypothetical protein
VPILDLVDTENKADIYLSSRQDLLRKGAASFSTDGDDRKIAHDLNTACPCFPRERLKNDFTYCPYPSILISLLSRCNDQEGIGENAPRGGDNTSGNGDELHGRSPYLIRKGVLRTI